MNKRLTMCFCAAVALSVLEFLAVPDVAQAAGADTLGRWSTLPYQMPINPIHVALLHNGKVLVVAGSENDPSSKWHRAAIWDRSTAPVARNIAWDLFCNAMSFLPDGRVLITGGTERYDPFYGESYAIIYSVTNDTFTEGPAMAEGRWYPTNTVLGDGRTVTISGKTRTAAVSKTMEIFDPATNSWSPAYPIPFTPKLYPWGHLLPNGKVFYAGPQKTSHMLDPDSLTWNTDVARTIYGGTRTYGSSVLLPLRPENNYPANVLIMGGHSPGATRSVERIDLSKPAPKWQSVQPMAFARINLTSTLLPPGEVLVTGGAPQDGVDNVNSRQAELFDPGTNTWRTLAGAAYSRHYHSVALLLPDATVWTAGSNPTLGYQKQMEIFEPPYLFTTNAAGQVIPAPRPSITAVPSTISYGKPFDVGTADTSKIASVVLVRPGAVTHAWDMEQRLVGLAFTKPSSTELRVTAPPDGEVAPPGYYMLFLINDKGVPSVAKFVQLHGAASATTATTVTLNPSADARVEEVNPGSNYGTLDTLRTRQSTGNNIESLLQFDLSGIPAGSTINSATLRLKITSVSTADTAVRAYRATASWAETGVTWSNRPGHAATAESTVSVVAADDETYKQWALTSLVGAWVSGSQANNGVKVRAEGGGFIYWDSRDRTGTSEDPELVITYTSGGTGTESAPSGATVGAWEPLQTLPYRPVHSVLLPTSKVLWWPAKDDAQIWDPSNGSITSAGTAGYNIFCAGAFTNRRRPSARHGRTHRG